MAVLLLVGAFFGVNLCTSFASIPSAQGEKLRFTVVKTTSKYVVAKRLKERVVVRKGSRVVVQNDVARFVVVRLTSRYVYLRRITHPPGPVNVKDYGARGDGVTDDRNAIARACAAAVGKTLYLPAGTYRMNTRLTMPSGVTVRGEGDASWLNGPVAIGSDSTFESLTIGRPGYACSVSGVSGVTFTKVRFLGGGGAFTNNWPYRDSHVITLTSASGILFDGCEIMSNSGTEDASKSLHFNNIFIQAATGVLFRGCQFRRSPRFNVEIWDDTPTGSREVNFEGCVFDASESASIDYSTINGGYSHITGCTFKGNGIGSNPRWVNDITVEKGASHVTATGNTFYRGRGCAFRAEDNGGDNVFSNNTVDSTNNVLDTGVTHLDLAWVLLTSDHNTVTGNTINNAGPGLFCIDIQAGSDNNVVTGNTLTGGGARNSGSNNVTAPNLIR